MLMMLVMQDRGTAFPASLNYNNASYVQGMETEVFIILV